MFLRARWFDPRTGRFVSKDTFPGYIGLPQTLNVYAYCFNNPINTVDPSGEIPPWLAPLLVIGEALDPLPLEIVVWPLVVYLLADTAVKTAPDAVRAIDRLLDPPITKPKWPGRDSPPIPKVIPDWVEGAPLAPQNIPKPTPPMKTFDPWLSPRSTPQPRTDPRLDPRLTPCPTVVATPTPKTPHLVIHFTDERGYKGIIHPGMPGPYIMKPSHKELTAPSGIYFTDDRPFPDFEETELYDRHQIAGTLGIPYDRTEFYIRIDKNRLPGLWTTRHQLTGIEWIYATSVPVDITQAIVDFGPTSQLNP